jgi:hypothetical protein
MRATAGGTLEHLLQALAAGAHEHAGTTRRADQEAQGAPAGAAEGLRVHRQRVMARGSNPVGPLIFIYAWADSVGLLVKRLDSMK